jgi:hypothetical protein
VSTTSWEKELRSEVDGDEELPPTPPKTRPNSSTFLLGIVILMTGLLAVVFYSKDKSPEAKVDSPPAPVKPFVPPTPADNSAQIKLIMDELRKIKQETGELKAEMVVLGQKVKIQGDRIIILGTITNDNAMGTRNGDRDPLYLTPDWGIPRMPRYLNPTGEDADFLQKHVK